MRKGPQIIKEVSEALSIEFENLMETMGIKNGKRKNTTRNNRRSKSKQEEKE